MSSKASKRKRIEREDKRLADEKLKRIDGIDLQPEDFDDKVAK